MECNVSESASNYDFFKERKVIAVYEIRLREIKLRTV